MKKRNVVVASMMALSVFGYSLFSYNHVSTELDSEKVLNEKNIVAIKNLTKKNQELLDMNQQLIQEKVALQEQNTSLEEEISRREHRVTPASRGNGRTIDVEATAYTDGGNTAIGVDLTGQSWDSARVIAVDPDVIPLGSQVHVTFHDPEWQYLNGVYYAADTGGVINGHIIDVFLGHGEEDFADQFGRRMATVEVL